MATLKNTTFNDTGFITLPAGTTAQRPASPVQGMSRYNTTLGYIEWYDAGGAIWRPIYQAPTISAEYLVVGGGGAGGADVGGGGGGGQVVYGTSSISPGTSISISVGAGGTKGGQYQYGFKGSNSTITLGGTTYTAVGGTGGAGRSNGGAYAGGTGYNGGGGSYDFIATPYSGGNSGAGSGGSTQGGGGGGSGAAASGVNGGNGLQYIAVASDSGANSGYYGGGGGGAPYPSGTSTGGLGGGANGNSGLDGTDGTAATGGAGSGGRSAATANGGNGGAGVIVIKIPSSYTLSGGTGLTYTQNTTYAAGYRIITITAGTGTISFG
jgi:hypothetical protein